MSSDIAIRVEGIGKCYQIYDRSNDRLLQMLLMGRRQYYKEFWALRNVSFEVRKGQTLGIVGRNGSGKSTLLQMICGTLNQTTGSVKLNGRVAALLELGSGFNMEFTGRENVYMNGSVLGLTKEEIDARFDDIVGFAEIGEFIDRPVKTYSSGMFVRLAFAVVAHVDAQILVIDEALAVGDAYFTQKCMRFLRGFREHGTLIFVSHDTAAIIGLCDQAIWLEKGGIVSYGAAKQVSEKYLASLYQQSSGVQSTEVTSQSIQVVDMAPPVSDVQQDCREELISRSALRNDIEIYDFKPGASAEFGLRGAEIRDVKVMGQSGAGLLQVVGGERVTIKISVLALKDLDFPIIGFSFKDRLGQVLFGDNTYLSYRDAPVFVQAGCHLVASFTFQMPILPAGDYSIAAAVASGTQNEHVQHHWIHDAIILKSISSSVSTGLIGLPMHSIEMSIDKNNIDGVV